MGFNPSRAVLVTSSSGAVGHSPIHWSQGVTSWDSSAWRGLRHRRCLITDPIHCSGDHRQCRDRAPAQFQGNNESKTLQSWLWVMREIFSHDEYIFINRSMGGAGKMTRINLNATSFLFIAMQYWPVFICYLWELLTSRWLISSCGVSRPGCSWHGACCTADHSLPVSQSTPIFPVCFRVLAYTRN